VALHRGPVPGKDPRMTTVGFLLVGRITVDLCRLNTVGLCR
jgi:hypothetical protein